MNASYRQHGFSLIEVLVGLAIGLIAALVITNVLVGFEKQKRTTTNNSDSQTNGAIALYNLQRDAQLAGYGLPVFDRNFSPYLCPSNGAGSPTIDHDENPASAAIGLSPIEIRNGTGANGSDEIAIHAGDSMTAGIGVAIHGTIGGAQVDNNAGCTDNSTVLLINGDTNVCALTRVNGNPAGNQLIPLDDNTNAAIGNYASCLGQWNEFRYTVDNNFQLTRSGSIVNGLPSATPVPIITSIVNMQAQYGVSNSPGNNRVTQWVNATGIWAPGAITTENRNRIKALRVAIVARSEILETSNVTLLCSSLTDANPTGLCAWDGSTTGSEAPAIDLSAMPNWQQYRYRVYESIIPLRNIIWSENSL